MAILTRSKPRGNVRWLVLCLATVVLLGSYFCYDIPSALHNQLDEYFDYDPDFEMNFNLMYSLYSLPNCVLPFLGGLLADRVGVRITIMGCSGLILCGQLIVIGGLRWKSMSCILGGRVLFGFGAESLSVSGSTLTSAWFIGRELAFAMGVTLSVSRLSSVANDLVSPLLAARFGTQSAFYFGLLICVLSISSAITLLCIEGDAPQTRPNGAEPLDGLNPATPDNSFLSTPKLRRPMRGRGGFSPLPSRSPSSGTARIQSTPPLSVAASSRKPITSIFTWGFVYLILHCMLVYGAILPFNNISSALLHARLSPEKVQYIGAIQGIPFTVSAFLTPIIGNLVDHFGKRQLWMLCSSLLLAVAHFILTFSSVSPIPSFVCIGLAYSVVAGVIWPSVPCVVDPEFKGLGFGLLTSLQNVTLCLTPLVIAYLLEAYGKDNFRYPELFMASLSLCAALMSLLLWWWDAQNGKNLWYAKSKSLPLATPEIQRRSPGQRRKKDNERSPLLSQAASLPGMPAFTVKRNVQPTDDTSSEPPRVRVQI